MNTPAHAVANLLILGRKNKPQQSLPIVIGAILPDLPMLGFYLYEKLLMGAPEELIWSTLYFTPRWQHFFDIFNSLPLMLIGLLIVRRFGPDCLRPLLLSMALHVFGDLPLHHDDAHAHFFPLSNWHFESPVSYWDPNYYGNLFAPLEALMVISGTVVLFRRYPSLLARALIAFVGASYLIYWVFVFWMWI